MEVERSIFFSLLTILTIAITVKIVKIQYEKGRLLPIYIFLENMEIRRKLELQGTDCNGISINSHYLEGDEEEKISFCR